MTVLELLNELEEIVNTAPRVPLASKVMVDANEILELAKDIRLSLPDDVQQAKWVIDEKDKIHAEAKSEYERIIIEARKQADTMVEEHAISQRAKDVAQEVYRRADEYSRDMRIRTYNYMDEVLYNFRQKMDEVNNKYFVAMYDEMDRHFSGISGKIDSDLEEVQRMAEEIKNADLPKHDIEIPVSGAQGTVVEEQDPEAGEA